MTLPHRNPRGNTGAVTASPLPRRPAGGGSGGGCPEPAVTPSRVVHGFTFTLPGRTRIFFQRQFFTNYPRPIQAGGVAPFPRTFPIATIQAPARQAIVINQVEFKAYQHSGIGIEDLDEVPRGRTIGTLGFSFEVGNRGLTDFSTNLPGTGVPVVFSTAGQGGQSTAPRAGQGNTFQGTGLATPSSEGERFAAYARPGDLIAAKATVFRPPSYDLRILQVSIAGWLADERELDLIIDRLTD